MEKVLITGATGFIGYELAHQLCALGYEPRLLIRRPSRGALFTALNAELLQGDLSRPQSLERAVEGVDTVFHLGARATFESYARLAPTNVTGAERLMSAAVRAGVTRFVFASSMFVHESTEQPISASTEPNPALDYGRAKLEAERRLQAMADACGMKLASVRLPHVYGPQSILFHQIRSGLVIFPGSMRNVFSHLHVADAARLLIEVARTEWTGASAVADQEPVDWVEFFGVLSDYYPRFHMLRIPQWLGHVGALAATPFVRLRGGPSMYTRDTVTGFNLNLPVEPALIWSDVGAKPQYRSIHDGIPAALDGSLHFRWRHPVLDREGIKQSHDLLNALPSRV
jgi:nucleoside-diphosphate-sugar epimerase